MAAWIAGCYSNMYSSMYAVFYLGTMSTFLFHAVHGWMWCWLRLKKLLILLTLPSNWVTDGSFSACCEAEFSVWAKHVKCGISASCAAMGMFDVCQWLWHLAFYVPFLHCLFQQLCDITAQMALMHCPCLQNMRNQLPVLINVVRRDANITFSGSQSLATACSRKGHSFCWEKRCSYSLLHSSYILGMATSVMCLRIRITSSSRVLTIYLKLVFCTLLGCKSWQTSCSSSHNISDYISQTV